MRLFILFLVFIYSAVNVASAGLKPVRALPGKNYALIVEVAGRDSGRPRAGDKLRELLLEKYGYHDVVLLKDSYATTSEVYNAVLDLINSSRLNDSISVFLFSTIESGDIKTGPILLTYDQLSDRSYEKLPISRIIDGLGGGQFGSVAVFGEYCNRFMNMLSENMPYRRADENTYLVFSCSRTGIRGGVEFSRDVDFGTVLVDFLDSNSKSVLTLDELVFRIEASQPSADIGLYQIQESISGAARFAFVIPSPSLDESAVTAVNNEELPDRDRILAFEYLVDSAIIESRNGNDLPIEALYQLAVEVASDASERTEVRLGLIDSLVFFPEPFAERALGALYEGISDEDSAVLVAVIRAVSSIAGDGANQILLRAISHPNAEVRMAVLPVVSDRKLEEAVDQIIEQLTTEQDEQLKIGQISTLAILADDFSFPSENLDYLKSVIKDTTENIDVRIDAMGLLAKAGGARYMEFFSVTAEAGPNERIREYSVYALANVEVSGVEREVLISHLIGLLEDDSENVRLAVIYSLGELKADGATRDISDILTNRRSSLDLRMAAAEALGGIASESAVGPLRKALKDDDQILRLAVIDSLASIGSERAAKAISTAFADPIDRLRRIALEHFLEIDTGEIDVSDELVEAVFTTSDPGVKALFIREVSRRDTEQTPETLIRVLTSRPEPHNDQSPVYVAALDGLAISKHRADILREVEDLTTGKLSDLLVAIDVLRVIDDAAATQLLVDLLERSNSDSHPHVVAALGYHASDIAIAALKNDVSSGQGHSLALDSLARISNTIFEDGETDRGIELLQEVMDLRMAQKPGDELQVALDFNNLGSMYLRIGELDVAGGMLQWAATISAQFDDAAPVTAASYSNLGQLYVERGGRAAAEGNDGSADEHYTKAAKYFGEALRYRERAAQQNPSNYANRMVSETLQSLANVMRLKGLEDAANEYERRAEQASKLPTRFKPAAPTIVIN